MKIGINASSLSNRKGGASFYMFNIIRAFANVDSKNSYMIFTTKEGRKQFINFPNNFSFRDNSPTNVFKRLLWEQFVLPFHCKKYSIKVLFSPNYTAPLFTPGFKSIVTVHDLSFFPLEKLYPRSRRFFKTIIHLSVRFSDAVIAVSEFTKKDILKYIGPFSNKISVIYEAADSRFNGAATKEQIDNLRKKYRLPEKYILFTGFLEPRKNLIRLLQAFALVKEKIQHHLVIAGGNGWWYEETYKKVTELGIQNYITFTGYVDDTDLPPLYSGATLFVFPSLYEGFGIAALESICSETPVLASNNTALPEVVGDAGVYVDPYNVNNIADQLVDVICSVEKLNQLKANCKKVKNIFDWNKTGIETIAILTQSLFHKDKSM